MNNLFKFLLIFALPLLVISCSKDDANEPSSNVSNEWGSLKSNGYAGTGSATDIKPLSATIKCSINKTFGPTYSYLGAQISTSSSFSSDRVEGGSALINGEHYTVDIDDLEPNTTYYYRAWVKCGGVNYVGDTRSFQTANYKIATSGFVNFDGQQWAAVNFGAQNPEELGYSYWWIAGNMRADEAYEHLEYLDQISGDPVLDHITREDSTLQTGDLSDLLWMYKTIRTVYKGVHGYAILTSTGEDAIFVPNGIYGQGKFRKENYDFKYYYLIFGDDDIQYESRRELYHYRDVNKYYYQIDEDYELIGYHLRAVKK